MATARVTICNKKGLHARAAAKLVKTAGGFSSPVTVTRLDRNGRDDGSAGATSILSLLMLAADFGSEIRLDGEGADAEAAIAAIIELVKRRFEEDE
jgi:phosphocarrier protein